LARRKRVRDGGMERRDIPFLYFVMAGLVPAIPLGQANEP